MATIKDVAKEAGVSVASVSRVINKSPKPSPATIESVTMAMKKLGYRPNANARALVSQSTNTVGVLVSDVSDPFFGTMVKAVDKVAHLHGKHILVGNGYHDEKAERKAIELLINSRCDALVIHSKALPDEELIQYAEEVKSLVYINRNIPQLAGAVSHSITIKVPISLPSTSFVMVTPTLHVWHRLTTLKTWISARRYRDALKANSINLSNSYIEYGSPDSDGGEKAMTNLLTKSLPISAVVAYNDNMAAGALSVLEENQYRLPNQMSMIGFDDGLIAKYLHPKLTTIRYPVEMMAEKGSSDCTFFI